MKFKFLEDIATADLAFDTYGKDLNELFTNAGMAIAEASANPKTVKAVLTKKILLKEPTIEKLLFSFLEELIFLKDSEPMVFKEISATVTDGKQCTMKATVIGDHIKQDEQELRMDIKAVTMHLFEVKKEKNGLKARVVVDI